MKMFLKAITCLLILVLTPNNIVYISATEYVASIGKTNFAQAFVNCEQANMRLAIITSSEDEARLHSYLVDITQGTENGYWLGATNLLNKSSKDYYWLATGAPVIYTNWFPTQPDNASGIENCLQWVYWNNRGNNGKGWNDLSCDRELRYVCERNCGIK